jgi:hypothetical protein
MGYDGHWAVTMACDDVVNGLRRGATAVNGAYSGDGRSATSPAQVGTRQQGETVARVHPQCNISYPEQLSALY